MLASGVGHATRAAWREEAGHHTRRPDTVGTPLEHDQHHKSKGKSKSQSNGKIKGKLGSGWEDQFRRRPRLDPFQQEQDGPFEPKKDNDH